MLLSSLGSDTMGCKETSCAEARSIFILMTYSNQLKDVSQLFKRSVLALALIFIVFFSAETARAAHTQQSSAQIQVPAPQINIEFPNIPRHFGYGGGSLPRAIPPKVNDLLRNLRGRVIDRVNSVLDRVLENWTSQTTTFSRR